MEKVKKFIPLVVGVILVVAGVFTYFRAGELVKNCTEKTTATVVDMREDITSDADAGIRYIYYPIIEYTVGDRTLTEEISSGSTTPAYRINEKIDILYNPNKAEEFIVEGSNQNITWIILGSVGIIFLAVGIYTLVKK